ncbi:hypothetical protein ACOME3_003352 [Neoechinorhynchus agilis]
MSFCAILVFLTLSKGQDISNWEPQCAPRPDEVRTNCHPEVNASLESCVSRKCCWHGPISGGYNTAPHCYHPPNYPGYVVNDVVHDSVLDTTTFTMQRHFKSHLPDEIENLTASVEPYNDGIIRLRIIDSNEPRFEVPTVLKDKIDSKAKIPSNVKVDYTTNPFTLRISRVGTGQVLLDTSIGPLLYANQFIEISTALPTDYVYGLGEHRTQFQISTNWRRMSFYTRDQATSLYGDHPFLMSVDEGGDAFGLFMLNSNCMEMVFQPYPLRQLLSNGHV